VHHKDVLVPRLRHEHELALHVAENRIIAHAPVVPLRTTLAERRARRALGCLGSCGLRQPLEPEGLHAETDGTPRVPPEYPLSNPEYP
jgi:hypothetical protein